MIYSDWFREQDENEDLFYSLPITNLYSMCETVGKTKTRCFIPFIEFEAISILEQVNNEYHLVFKFEYNTLRSELTANLEVNDILDIIKNVLSKVT